MPLVEEWEMIKSFFIELLERLQRKIAMYYESELSFGLSSYAQPLTQVPLSLKRPMKLSISGVYREKQALSNCTNRRKFLKFCV